jgi:hypothetical protein
VHEVHDPSARPQEPRADKLREERRAVGVGAKVAAEVRRVVCVTRDDGEPQVRWHDRDGRGNGE